jgi:hypothetical protein
MRFNFFTGPDRKSFEEQRRRRILDRDVLTEKRSYSFLDSSMEKYSHAFSYVLRNQSLSEYLKTRFGNKRISALDLGGQGRNLFEGLSQTEERLRFKKTAGVSLNDINPEAGLKQHKHFDGDIFNDETVAKVSKFFKPGIDLITSRMAAGLEFVPGSPLYLYKYLNEYYKLLNTGGTMILQLPGQLSELIKEWEELFDGETIRLRVSYPFDLDHRAWSNGSSVPAELLTILLEKNEGAPEDLPKVKFGRE